MTTVLIARKGEDGKPGTSATTSQEAFEQVWQPRGYGLVNEAGDGFEVEPSEPTISISKGA